MIAFLKRSLQALLVGPLALLLIFEEWGWAQLASGFAALGRLPVWRQIERLIRQLPPWAALMAFGMPVLLLVPVKLLALFLLGKGHVAAGLALVLTAKVAGTALAARLFQLTEPALMQLGWFGRWYPRWTVWKDRLFRQVRLSVPWRLGRRLRFRLRAAGASARAAWRALRDGKRDE